MNIVLTILIDDERLAREELKLALKKYPDFVVIGEASEADAARLLIEQHRPDLIFLDIQMPEENGFDLLESLDYVPAVIFTTAFDQYAVLAFERNALDYLVKPMRAERFQKAIDKVRKTMDSVSEESKRFSNHQVFIKDGNKCFFLKLNDVYLIQSLGNYARLHFMGKNACIKRSLNQLEAKLDRNVFFRINRTTIINTLYIKQIYTMHKRRLKISLQSGETVDVSSRKSLEFKNLNRL